MPEPGASSHQQVAPHRYRWAVLTGVWLAYYCFGLTTVTMAPLVGAIGADLGLNHARMGTVLGAWQITFVVAAVPCGILLERVGPRRAILFAFAVFASSAALRAAAVDHMSLFAAVTIFGLGAPMVSIGAPKLISQWFESSDRGVAMGLYISGPFLGNITGLSLTNSVLMPALNDDWRTVMLVYAGFVLIAGLLWLGITADPAYRAAEQRMEAEPREPQIQAFNRLIAVPAVRIVLFMVLGIFLFNHALTNWLPEILLTRGLDASAAGFWASIPTAVAIGSALTIPRFATPQRRTPILFCLFTAAGVATLLLHTSPGPMLAGGLILQGLARGAMMTVTILLLLEIPQVGSKRAGMAGGMFFSMAELGGVLGPVSVGIVSDVAGFDVALNLLGAVSVLLVCLLFLLRRRAT
jgi:cyanate permease